MDLLSCWGHCCGFHMLKTLWGHLNVYISTVGFGDNASTLMIDSYPFFCHHLIHYCTVISVAFCLDFKQNENSLNTFQIFLILCKSKTINHVYEFKRETNYSSRKMQDVYVWKKKLRKSKRNQTILNIKEIIHKIQIY